MTVCTHFKQDREIALKTPTAVPFAWFLLGVLLLFSDSTLITLGGALLAIYGGYWLFFRCRMLLCCFKNYREAKAAGRDKPSPCCLRELLM